MPAVQELIDRNHLGARSLRGFPFGNKGFENIVRTTATQLLVSECRAISFPR
jgi:hypothetical protein